MDTPEKAGADIIDPKAETPADDIVPTVDTEQPPPGTGPGFTEPADSVEPEPYSEPADPVEPEPYSEPKPVEPEPYSEPKPAFDIAELVPFIGMVGVLVTTTALRNSYSREQLSRKVLGEFMRSYDELKFPKLRKYPKYDKLSDIDRQHVQQVLVQRATLPGMTEMYDEYPQAVYNAATSIAAALASYSGPQ